MIAFLALQADVVTDETAALSIAGFPDVTALFHHPLALLVLTLLGIAAAVIITLFMIRGMYNRRGRAKVAFGMRVLLIRVPKELKKEDAEQSKSTQQIQELISVMETVFSTLGSLRAEKGIVAWLIGRKDQCAFEIVAHRNKISFYVAIPGKYRQFVEEQIHAQYPNAQIDDVPDYNMFAPQGVILGSYLTFRRNTVFPIKTYKKLESDPLNSLTNALSKIEDADGGAVQFIVRSARPTWRNEGIRIAKAMQQGKKLSDVNKGSGILHAVGSELWSIVSSAKPGEKKDKECIGFRRLRTMQRLEEKPQPGWKRVSAFSFPQGRRKDTSVSE